MEVPTFKKYPIPIVLSLIIGAGLYSFCEVQQRNTMVEQSQLDLIVSKLQMENRNVFSNVETSLKLECKKIATGGMGFINGRATFSALENLIDVSDKVAAIGIFSETGEEYAIQKRNGLYATYFYNSAADSLADVTQWDAYRKRDVIDTLVGNRMYNAALFKMHMAETSGKIIWRGASDLPGFAGRKGLSASAQVTDISTGRKYIIVFFVPFKRLMTNTIKAGFKKGDVFLFRNDSLFYNFDCTADTVSGFDTTQYFIPWKDIQDKKQLAALNTWQTLTDRDSIRSAHFSSEGVNYYAAFSPVMTGNEGTYYALVVPSEKLVTLLNSKTGKMGVLAFVVLFVSGIVFSVIYVTRHRKVRFIPLTADQAKQLIAGGENDQLEFKSTIRTNLHAGKPGKEIELAWLKSVVAFCNTEGGTILIGVNDDGEIRGLDDDLFQDDDKCLLHVQNLISEHVGLEYLPYVRFYLLPVDGTKILAVQCIPLKKIMLLKSAGREQFYVRSGSSSVELPVSKVPDYVNDWSKRV